MVPISYRRSLATGLLLLLCPVASWMNRSVACNFVIIMADDLGYGDLSCYGGDIPTPRLDQMAQEGLRFTDFHSSGNVCSPTRAGLLTGRYQQRAGIPMVINADPDIPAHHLGLAVSEITFAELLHQAGYATGVFGKWHLGYDRKFNPKHHGFDQFRGFVSGNIDYLSHYDRMETYDWWHNLETIVEEGYTTHLITDHAIDFMRQNRERPFCVYVAHEAVHSPWQGPTDAIQRGPDKPARPRVNRERAFREMLTELDQGVGKILDAVDELGLSEETLVWFFSDNGPAGGSAGPLRGRKGSDWEGGHRVPAIARWQNTIAANELSDQMSITLDVMPTMLSLANITPPQNHEFDGADLSVVLKEGRPLGDRKLFWNGRAMRDGPWKLIQPKGAAIPQLYNLTSDLPERHDLASQHPQRVAEMSKQLAAWEDDVSP